MRRRRTLAAMMVRRSVFDEFERGVAEMDLERYDREMEAREGAERSRGSSDWTGAVEGVPAAPGTHGSAEFSGGDDA